jgi:hypothetical protein
MRLGRRRQEPLSEAEAVNALYGEYAREPHRQALVEVAPRSVPLAELREANDEALAWELEALPADSRELVLRG